MSTIVDVARLAGVSPATVSRVLTGSAEVKEALAVRVRSAVLELDYRPNRIAQSLRTRTTKTWGVVITDIQNPFYTSLVRGIEDVAREAGYSVMLCNSDEDLEKEAEYFEVLASARTAGVVLAPASVTETNIEAFLDHDIPVVAIDRRLMSSKVDTVVVDNVEGARYGTAHLIQLGKRRVACITGSLQTTTGVERLEGYRVALEDDGLEIDDQLVRVADFKEAGGYAATLDLLRSPKPPDAIFVANNLMTLGAVEALRDEGVGIPMDVAIVGFDDEPWAQFSMPSITVVAQPTYELGTQAARLLLERLDGSQAEAREIVLSPVLRVRDSG